MNDLIEPDTMSARGTELAPAASPSPTNMLAIIARAAADPAVDVSKMQALLTMQRELMADQARAEFNAASARLAARLPRIKKTGVLEYPVNKNEPHGPKYKVSNFAKWEDIDKAIRPLLEAEGFALSFDTQQRPGDGGGLIVTATLLHVAGHSRSSSIPVPLDTSGGKNNLQGYGSTLSYGKRYAACAALNIVTEGEDDDGRTAEADPIDDDKVRQINDLIRDTKSDARKFLAWMGVERVPDIDVRDFPRAINRLETKKRQMAEGKTP